jgi:hypothetical protein
MCDDLYAQLSALKHCQFNPAGLLPTLGGEGAYMASRFQLGLLMKQLRALGFLGVVLFYTLFSILGAPAKSFCW